MARRKISRAELDLEMTRHTNITALLSKAINTAFVMGGIALCFYFVYRSVEVLAGQRTFADVGINLGVLFDLRLPEVLGLVFGGGGIVYGVGERTYRKQKVKQLGSRIKSLESHIDPQRTSSGLTPRGNTRKEDK